MSEVVGVYHQIIQIVKLSYGGNVVRDIFGMLLLVRLKILKVGV
jgi:hypothetical protein